MIRNHSNIMQIFTICLFIFINNSLYGIEKDKVKEVDELFTKKEITKSDLIGFFEWNAYMYSDKRIIEFKEDNTFIYREYYSGLMRNCYEQVIGSYKIENDTILFNVDKDNIYYFNNGIKERKEEYNDIIKLLKVPVDMVAKEFNGIFCLLDGFSYYFIHLYIDEIKKEQEKALFFYRKDNQIRSTYVFLKQ